MRKFLVAAGTAALALGSTMVAASAQPIVTAPPVVQTQANPPGEGVPTTTPPNPATASDAVPPAQPADPSYNAGPYKGALTPPPVAAMDKTYPVCTRQIQDSCQNRGEGGAPGKSRALPYYRP
jgi:hypothetical protein